MIGIGKWQGEIITPFGKGKGTVEICDNNGKYAFLFDLPEKYKNVKITYHEIKEIGSNTLLIKAQVLLFPNKIAQIKVSFEGDRMFGFIRLPIMGGYTVEIKNGQRVKT